MDRNCLSALFIVFNFFKLFIYYLFHRAARDQTFVEGIFIERTIHHRFPKFSSGDTTTKKNHFELCVGLN